MISVVMCSRDDRKFANVRAMYSRVLADGPFEIIRIPDATGLCEGYTRGLAQSSGEIVIFSHDDMELLADDARSRMLAHLEFCDLLGVAGATRVCNGNWLGAGPPYIYGQVLHQQPLKGTMSVAIYGAPRRRIDHMVVLDGVFLCCRRESAIAIGFDTETFTGFHMYDLDFTFRAHLAGLRLSVCTDLDVLHMSDPAYDETWMRDAERFFNKHKAALWPFSQPFTLTHVTVNTIQAGLERMRPPHWED